jgi:trk system potassium uptake protein
MSQVLGSNVCSRPRQPVDQAAEQCHEGEVWQYRRAGEPSWVRRNWRLHVVIAGCGRVGSELATSLERLGHSVVVIDKNPKAFDRLRNDFKGNRLTGFAFDRDVLEEAGIKEAEAFASVTSGDNSNILSARVAREFYRVPQVVARIYDPKRAQIYQRLGIQTVATVRWTTDQMLRFLLPDDIPVEYTVDNGEVVITSIQAPHAVVGRSALELDLDGERRVVALSRFGVPRVPDKSLTIQDGDILHFSIVRGGEAELKENLEQVGRPE